jgi:hypothetical protein
MQSNSPLGTGTIPRVREASHLALSVAIKSFELAFEKSGTVKTFWILEWKVRIFAETMVISRT